jgi:hypothetical protein
LADDGKRSEVLCTKVTERMALDMLRLASLDDRSVSEFMFLLIRRELYGHIVKLNDDAEQTQR